VIQLTITGGGPLGTATFDMLFNGSSAATGTTSASVATGDGVGVTISFPAGEYDTSNTWTWNAGTIPVGSASVGPFATGLAGQSVFAIGLGPVDFASAQSTSDSVLVRAHSAALGAFTVTLPSTPWDGMRVAVMDADGSSFGKPISVAASGGKTIQNPWNLNTFGSGGSAFATIAIPYQCVTWCYDASGAVQGWRIEHDTHLETLPSITKSGAGSLVLAGKAWVKASTTSSAIAITTPANPTEGMRIRVSDAEGNAAVHNITVTAAAGQTIDTLALGGGASFATISTDDQGAEWAYSTGDSRWVLVAINGPHA
jgi:hypothetical protein